MKVLTDQVLLHLIMMAMAISIFLLADMYYPVYSQSPREACFYKITKAFLQMSPVNTQVPYLSPALLTRLFGPIWTAMVKKNYPSAANGCRLRSSVLRMGSS